MAVLGITITLYCLQPPQVPPVVLQPEPVIDQPDELPTTPPESSTAVRLTQVAGAEFFGERVPAIHDHIPLLRTYALIRGQIELTFPKGATAIVKGPALFSIETPERLNLQVGSCSVHAPEGAEGFRVMTPKSEVVDLGTRFSVKVSDSGQSDVQVVEGAAEVHLASADRSQPQLLKSGQAIRTSQNTQSIVPIPFQAQQYQSSLPDRVLSYEAEQVPGTNTVRDLVSVTVQRGGVEWTYPVQDLIGIEVLHFRASKNSHNIAWDGTFPEHPVDLLEKDVALNTGLFNPGGRNKPPAQSATSLEEERNRPGLAVRFRTPLRNAPGADLVLFEVQSPIYPAEGDAFRVGPIVPTAGLNSHLVERYDITLHSKNALLIAPFNLTTLSRPPRSLDELNSPIQASPIKYHSFFSAIAVGIDLSSMGYADGEEVSELFFENAKDEEFFFDPVFIGGFPPLESPVK